MKEEEMKDIERGEICYFCKTDLKKVDRREKIDLRCCQLIAHKKELFQWFLKHQYCPNCLAEDKKTRQQILDWGLKKETKKEKQRNQ